MNVIKDTTETVFSFVVIAFFYTATDPNKSLATYHFKVTYFSSYLQVEFILLN